MFIYQIWSGIASLPDLEASSPSRIFLAAGLVVFAIGCQITAWMIMTRALGITVNPMAVYQNYTLSFIPKYIPGGVWGYLSRNEWMLRDFNVKYSTSNLLSILELSVSIFINILLIAAALVQMNSKVSVVLLIPLLFLLVIFGWICFQYIGKKMKNKIPAAFVDLDLLPRISLKTWLTNSLLFFIYWFSFGIAMWLLCSSQKGIPIITPDDRIWGFVGVYCISWLIGFLVLFAPSGLGIRETSINILLNGYLSVPSNTAALTAVIMRVLSVVGEFVWILLGLILKLFMKIRKRGHPVAVTPKHY